MSTSSTGALWWITGVTFGLCFGYRLLVNALDENWSVLTATLPALRFAFVPTAIMLFLCLFYERITLRRAR